MKPFLEEASDDNYYIYVFSSYQIKRWHSSHLCHEWKPFCSRWLYFSSIDLSNWCSSISAIPAHTCNIRTIHWCWSYLISFRHVYSNLLGLSLALLDHGYRSSWPKPCLVGRNIVFLICKPVPGCSKKSVSESEVRTLPYQSASLTVSRYYPFIFKAIRLNSFRLISVNISSSKTLPASFVTGFLIHANRFPKPFPWPLLYNTK